MDLTIPIDDPSVRPALFGPADRNLRIIRAAFDVRISARDQTVHLSGSAERVARAAAVLKLLQQSLRDQPDLSEDFVKDTIERAWSDSNEAAPTGLEVFLPAHISPRGPGQQRYIEAIATHDITIATGPAGSGKTYLAVAVAASLLKQRRIKRIVLVRPAVEAGEKLGFLPGDVQAKVNPYLRPLFDALHDMMTFEQLRRFVQSDVIEIAPLAYMRGRTLNHAVVILDEAQNATQMQMFMFLTRLGHDSKMIVTGDASQSDLAPNEKRGLIDAIGRLEGIAGIAVVRLTAGDIVRHPLVQEVVTAYASLDRDVR